MITTEEECRNAIESIYQINSYQIWNDGDYDEVPGGCSYKDNYIHFNTGLITSNCCTGRWDLVPICKVVGSNNIDI